MKTIQPIRMLSAITIAVALGMLAIIRADAPALEVAALRHTTLPDATMATEGASGTRKILYLGKGRVYRGEAFDGRPHGEGTLTWPSGAAYTGQWANGARHGAGTYRDREGGIYAGRYRDGERSEHGRFTWPNGRIYEGPWRAGIRSGEGVETEADGITRRCTWRWDNLVPGSCSAAG